MGGQYFSYNSVMKKAYAVVIFLMLSLIQSSCVLFKKTNQIGLEQAVVPPLTEPNPAFSVELDSLIDKQVTGGHYFGLNSGINLSEIELQDLKKSFKSKNQINSEQDRRRKNTLLQALKESDFSKTKDYSVDEIIRVGSKFNDNERESVIEKLIADSTCYPEGLTLSFGALEEKELPHELAYEKVYKLYEKTFDCGDGEVKAKAAYRLGLLHIAKNQCDLSLKYWDVVAQTQEVKFLFSRANYWRNHCSMTDKQRKDSALSFYQNYPLSFHSILALKEAEEDIGPVILNRQQPKVLVRTEIDLKINLLIDHVEKLIAEGELNKAKDMLSWLSEDKVNTLEPRFRLYLSYLSFMTKDGLGTFQFLAKVLSTYPELKTKSTLNLFYPKWYYNIIEKESHKHGLDPLLVTSLIRQESAFNKEAKSRVGARGLMQLMPATAKGVNRHLKKDDLYNPEKNLEVGVAYFANLLNRYNGNVTFALAAYNAGFGAVDKWIDRYKVDNQILFSDLIPYRETREYVASILRNYYWYKLMDQYQVDSKDVVVGGLNKIK